MKRRKIYAGTLALALSIGVVTPIENNAIGSVAYASQSTQDIQAQKYENLKKLIQEQKNVETSPRYETASTTEQNNYKTAIQEAGKADKQTSAADLDAYISDIQNAKANLSASYFNTYEQREGLESTIALAQKLSNNIQNNSNISSADKDRIKISITSAQNDAKDAKLNADQINNSNKNLAQVVNDIISKYDLKADGLALTNDEISNVRLDDNAALGKAYKKLYDLDIKAYGYTELDEFKNIKDEKIKGALVSSLTEAKAVYENPNSTTSDFNTAYDNLNKAYNDALLAADGKNTEASRIRSQLQKEVNNPPAEYEKAGATAKSTYTNAKNKAESLLKNNNATAEELSKALNNLKLAKFTLAPVETKIIDNNQEEKAPKDTLKELIDGSETYKNQDPYKSASNEAKKSYDNAITAAKGILENNQSTNTDIDAAIQTIKDAQSNLSNSKTNEDKDNFDQAKILLDSLVRNKDNVYSDDAYKKSDTDKKEAYKKAIESAKSTLSDIASEKTVSLDTINKNIKDIVDALTNLGYKDVVKYPTTLKELVEEAPSFRQTYGYYLRKISKDDGDRALINTYNELISLVSENLETLNKDKDLSQKYVDRINEIKREIVGNSNQSVEVENKKILEELLDLATKVQAHPDYIDVTTTQSKNLNEAIIEARRALESNRASDIAIARTYLTNQLNQSEIKPIVEKIKNEKESTDLKELRNLLDYASEVTKHKDYANIKKELKDELEKAIEQANLAITSKDETKIKEAKDTLFNILQKDEFKSIIQDLEKSQKSSKEKIEEIIKGDKALRETTNYKKAQKSLREAYDKALNEAKAILDKENASDDELKTASTNLVNALQALDGNEFTDRVKKLKEKFQKESSNITDANKKGAVEEKIKALDDENATMDDLLAAEAELANALKLNGTTTPVTTTTTTTPVSGTTTTTTPVTTTRQVPATINPGSIVRTGIKSLVGVGVVLVVALGAYALTGKNKNKKEDNLKTKRRDNNEIK